MRVGEDKITKNIDRFSISKGLINYQFRIRQWVGSGGESDHFSILLEMAQAGRKQSNPFKFNSFWVVDEDFFKVVQENCTPFDWTIEN
jgi:hypothetical protein